MKIEKYVSLPATAKDYSPQVAEATGGGTDCLVMIVSETPYIAWMPAFAQSGSKARMYGPQGNLNEKVVKGFEQLVDRLRGRPGCTRTSRCRSGLTTARR